jgi:hypothetical protein
MNKHSIELCNGMHDKKTFSVQLRQLQILHRQQGLEPVLLNEGCVRPTSVACLRLYLWSVGVLGDARNCIQLTGA